MITTNVINQIRSLESYLYNYELQCRQKGVSPNLSKVSTGLTTITNEIRKESVNLIKK